METETIKKDKKPISPERLEQLRAAGRARAAAFTKEYQQTAAKQAGMKKTLAQLSEMGKKGYEAAMESCGYTPDGKSRFHIYGAEAAARVRYGGLTRLKPKEVSRKEQLKQNGGSHTRAEWEALKARHNYRCVKCGRQEPQIKLTRDHIVAVARGGSDSITNIQPLCESCNKSKHAGWGLPYQAEPLSLFEQQRQFDADRLEALAGD